MKTALSLLNLPLYVWASQASRQKFMLKSSYMGLGEYDRTDHGDKTAKELSMTFKLMWIALISISIVLFLCAIGCIISFLVRRATRIHGEKKLAA